MLVPDDTLQNRYRIIGQLGKGGMGAVYRAWDMRLSIPVALKEMIAQADLEVSVLEELRNQFQQEAVTLARLNHPNLVGVTDYFQEGRSVYLVMQFVEGESLSQRIQREGALPEQDVTMWTSQLLDALAYCHSQGVIHRDIKPQNIILTPEGRAVLVDFGLVKLWDPSDPSTRTAVRGVGTPQYAPPEQYEVATGHTEPRTDLYSLAATMYHAFTGQAPPTATKRIADPDTYVPLSALAPHVSSRVTGAIERAMELARSRRWGTAFEMAGAMGLSIRPWGQTGPVDGRTEVMSGRGRTARLDTASTQQIERRRFPTWVLGLLAVGVVAAGVAVLLFGAAGVFRQRLGLTVGATSTPVTVAAWARPPDTPTPSVVPPTATPTPSPSPTVTATLTARPTRTQRPTRTATPTAAVTATPEATEAVLDTATPEPADTPALVGASTGALVDFETWGTWRRGDQPNGELSQDTVQVKAGSYAARLAYSFGSSSDDYVVFSQARAIGGTPDSFTAWVYGDGSSHFLNLWIRDARGEVWSVALGRVGGAGWQQMAGSLAPGLAWPNGHISGPDNGVVDFPVSFDSIVLDRPESGPLSGAITIDEITARNTGAVTPTAAPTVAAGAPTNTPAPVPAEGVGRILFTVSAEGGTYLYTTDPVWNQMQEIGRTDYAHSTCAPGITTVSTLAGQSFDVVRPAGCAVTERSDACTSPDGAYRLITSFLPGWEWAVLLEDVAAGDEHFVYQGKLSQEAGVRWDPTSRRVAFGIGQSIQVVTPGFDSYVQAVSAYDPTWPVQFSPDGSTLLFVRPSGGEGNSDVFLVGVDGSGERNLTNAPAAQKMCPMWRR